MLPFVSLVSCVAAKKSPYLSCSIEILYVVSSFNPLFLPVTGGLNERPDVSKWYSMRSIYILAYFGEERLVECRKA